MAQGLKLLTEVQLVEAQVLKARSLQSARKAKMLRIDLASVHLCLALWVPSPVQVSLLGRPVMVV